MAKATGPRRAWRKLTPSLHRLSCRRRRWQLSESWRTSKLRSASSPRSGYSLMLVELAIRRDQRMHEARAQFGWYIERASPRPGNPTTAKSRRHHPRTVRSGLHWSQSRRLSWPKRGTPWIWSCMIFTMRSSARSKQERQEQNRGQRRKEVGDDVEGEAAARELGACEKNAVLKKIPAGRWAIAFDGLTKQ